MKTTSVPTLPIDPALRQAAEGVLRENESLSTYVEAALRESIARRRLQREFVARGLAAREQARNDNQYFEATDAQASLEHRLAAAKALLTQP